jgi:HK97 family phage portal protein
VLKHLRARLSEIGSLSKPSQWMLSFFGVPENTSKIAITHDVALQISTVYACVYALADDVSKLPIRVYRQDAETGDETEQRAHPLAKLLRRPNPIMTGKVYREVMQHHLMLWGNAFSEIVFDAAGMPIGLYPIEPWRVWIELKPDGRIVYHVDNQLGRDVELEPAQVLHLKLLSKDGIKGISVLTSARETMGLSIASERAAAKLFGGGMMPAGVLKHPGKLSPTAQENLRESLEKRYGGPENSGKPMVLQEGMEYTVLGMPLKDAQFLEQRQLSVPEICRFFRVPAHIAGDLTRSTNNNIEHQSLEYGMYTLLGHARRWEEEIEMKLARYYPDGDVLNVEHDLDELLRADMKTRGESYQRGRQWGYLTANDIRRDEKRPAFTGVAGTQILVPVNMTTPEKLESGSSTPQPSPTDPNAVDPADPDASNQDLARGILKIAIEKDLRGALKVEADKVTRAVKGGTFDQLAREWYPGHEQHVATQITRMLTSVGPLLLRAGCVLPAASIERLARELAAKHRATSLAEASDAELVTAWTDGRLARDADEWASHVLAQIAQE